MRPFPVLAATVVAGFAWVTPASAGAAPSDCSPARTTTLARSDRARLFRRTDTGQVFACWFARPEPFAVDDPTVQDDALRPMRLAGRFAAVFFETQFADGGAATTVTVVDLVTREPRDRVPTRVAPRNPTGPVRAMVLTHAGNLGFVSCRSSTVRILRCAARDPGYQVIRVTKSGETLLDSGSTIDPGSLRARNGRLGWLHAGSRRAATLP
jgi:hypothetical protein